MTLEDSSVRALQVRTLEEADAASLDAFLARHAPTSLSLLHNVREGGVVCGGLIHQAHYLGLVDRHGLHGVLALGTDDLVRIQCPLLDAIPLLVTAWKDWFAGRPRGVLGPRPQVDRVCELLAEDSLSPLLNVSEDVFVALTAGITPPASAASRPFVCRPAVGEELPLLCAWHVSFLQEVGRHTDTDAVRDAVFRDLSHRLSQNGLFVMVDETLAPVAAIHAILAVGETVQAGALYVPPEKRGEGYGLTLLCLFATWLAQRGVTRLTYLTAGERWMRFNTRAEACGFRRLPDQLGTVLIADP